MIRVCKARWPGLCCQCSGPVIIGQRIAEITPGQWAHVTCAVKLTGDDGQMHD